jgi:hypothetical protein
MINKNKYIMIIIIFIIIIGLYFKQMFPETFLNRNKQHKCFDTRLTNVEKSSYIQLIKTMNNILIKHNIDWIPVGGSLLAIYRHKNIFIPWDDDYDIVINNKQIDKALHILKLELPKHHIQLNYHRKWNQGGDLYKISYMPNHPKYKNVIKKYGKYTWPYIDIFTGSKNINTCLSLHNLNKSEYPLKTILVNGILLKVPTNGSRNYNTFSKKDLLTTCYEKSYVHKYEKNIKCIGNNTTKCSNLPN